MLRAPSHHVPAARHAAIDAHNHLGRWLGAGGRWVVEDRRELLSVMDRANVHAIVNADGRWGQELEANLERYDRWSPGRFATLCHLDWREAAAAGFGDRLAASLRRSRDVGAVGLKVWKDLGLHVRDGEGRILFPDDERLAAVWESAGELGMPVLIHVADPRAFFEPVDATNERLEELLAHPDWSFADTRFPRFDRIIAALEAVVASHPRTTFIGAHVGCNAEDLAWVDRMLSAYPNFHVDVAARIAELGRQPRAAAAMIRRHPGRVLFGTDEFPPDAETYAIHFRFLETADEHFPYSVASPPPQGRWAISGLDLTDGELRAVEHDNASRLFPALAAGG
jgi:predicted TIM-barrel fold metal-dependent hydrolase